MANVTVSFSVPEDLAEWFKNECENEEEDPAVVLTRILMQMRSLCIARTVEDL